MGNDLVGYLYRISAHHSLESLEREGENMKGIWGIASLILVVLGAYYVYGHWVAKKF